jgi:hypothetical protein
VAASTTKWPLGRRRGASGLGTHPHRDQSNRWHSELGANPLRQLACGRDSLTDRAFSGEFTHLLGIE